MYAQGGPGNTRLITWEGERTLTFTVEDALLSPIGFAILSGAGLFKKEGQKVHVHTTASAYIDATTADDGIQIDLTDALEAEEEIDDTAPVFVAICESDGSITGELLTGLEVSASEVGGKKKLLKKTGKNDEMVGKTVFVDFYILKDSANVSELTIDASHFAGNYYVEASTLFRRQSDGVDMPAELTLPNVKIQSNFTFNMASTGDPSTFSFTMDAFPGYTMFNCTKKVLCVMQVVEDASLGNDIQSSVMAHTAGFNIEETGNDSTDKTGELV